MPRINKHGGVRSISSGIKTLAASKPVMRRARLRNSDRFSKSATRKRSSAAGADSRSSRASASRSVMVCRAFFKTASAARALASLANWRVSLTRLSVFFDASKIAACTSAARCCDDRSPLMLSACASCARRSARCVMTSEGIVRMVTSRPRTHARRERLSIRSRSTASSSSIDGSGAGGLATGAAGRRAGREVVVTCPANGRVTSTTRRNRRMRLTMYPPCGSGACPRGTERG